MPLNGAAANTEGGRLQRAIAKYANYQAPFPEQGNPTSCYGCVPEVSPQPTITPSEGSRIALLTATNNGTMLNGGGVTQDRARQLLAALAGSQQYGSEGMRIAALQQAVAAAAPNQQFLPSIVIPVCPTIPGPPAPPAPACPLPKYMRLGGM
jgi:hypothetical protein